jgi:hypothetical protein
MNINHPSSVTMVRLSPRALALYLKATEERDSCRLWLSKFMLPDQRRAFTKKELKEAAIAQLGISKNSFEHAWYMLIEETQRFDWSESLPRSKSKQDIN